MAVSKGSGLTPKQTPRPAALSGWPGGGMKTVFCGRNNEPKRKLMPSAVNMINDLEVRINCAIRSLD